jgi:hypothetical protein
LGEYGEQYQETVMGGLDVFRDSRNHQEGVNWNIDHYVIIRDTVNGGALLMYGPFRDHEHWINEIPKRLKNVEILTFDR